MYSTEEEADSDEEPGDFKRDQEPPDMEPRPRQRSGTGKTPK
jgi:hypothetical protein